MKGTVTGNLINFIIKRLKIQISDVQNWTLKIQISEATCFKLKHVAFFLVRRLEA